MGNAQTGDGREETTFKPLCARVDYGYMLKEIAGYLAIHYTTVSRAIARETVIRKPWTPLWLLVLFDAKLPG